MKNDTIRNIKLEKHDTKDINDSHINGSLTVIWRDWDKILEVEPKMVYVSSVNSGEIKGPHLHTTRDSYFVCIRGKVVFVIKDKDGKYLEIKSRVSLISRDPIFFFSNIAPIFYLLSILNLWQA